MTVRYKLAQKNSAANNSGQMSPPVSSEKLLIGAEARTAFSEWGNFLRSKTVRGFNDPDVMQKAAVLQQRLVNLLSNTTAQSLWEKIENTGTEARRAYAKGNEVEFQRLLKLQEMLGAQLKTLLEQGDKSGARSTAAAQYSPPDFEKYFPDDTEGGRKLDALWQSSDKDARPDAEILQTIQNGLRRTKEHRTLILRWLGNRYIWNKNPQNPEAIEIMYHAADWRGKNNDPYGTRHYAVYFGLSVVQPKTPAILRALVELCIAVDDPNDLDRIAWGVKNQQADFLIHLKPHHASENESVRDKARLVEQIIKGESKAFAWATEKARERAQEKFSDQLPGIKETLASGSSEKRMETLRLIAQERLTLIMDDTFVSAYARCAESPEPKIRSEVARQVGERWVWSAEKQNQEAIELMLKLSHDDDREVRGNAVYFGLSTIRNKNETVIKRLLEMALTDRERNRSGTFGRIIWGLASDRDSVKRLLDDYLKSPDLQQAKAAREIYEAFTGRKA